MTFLNLNHLPDQNLRHAVIETSLRMNFLGINHGKSGNVSVRTDTGFLITPTGIAYEKLAPAQIVAMKIDNNANGTFDGEILPSSEWRFHHDIYAVRKDVAAIVHTHAIHATALAVLGREIPAFHYMVAAAGGDNIRCAEYATFGTQKLSDNVLTALENRKACLMAQHGMIACGANLESALALAVEVEALARIFLNLLQTQQPIPILDAAEMQVVLKKFLTYGQQPDVKQKNQRKD